MKLHHFTKTVGASAVALIALAGSALADGYGGSVKDAAPAAEGRTFSYSVNAALTTDYMFRGLSQSSEGPAVSAGLDIGYGIFYAGFWGSSIDFDGASPDNGVELDVYAGIKPVVGPITFDFAVLGYFYPGNNEDVLVADEADYLELKAGASITPFTNATLGVATYYSPDFSGAADEAFAVEGSAGYTFNAIGRFTPSISGAVGYQVGDFAAGIDDDYVYWNVGLGVGFDKFTLDVRYWDTDINDANNGFAFENTSDERVVGTIKVVLP